MPVVVENDANTLAVYEQWFGAGRGRRTRFAVVTIGAGIGCGLVLDGALYTGATGAAGEFGHLIVEPDGPPCQCGRHGCLESIAGDDAVMVAATEALGRPVASTDEVHRSRPRRVAPAREVFRRAGTALGRGLAALVNLINPELMILSGEGISRVTPMMDALRESLAAEAFSSTARDCRLLVRPLARRDLGGRCGGVHAALRGAELARPAGGGRLSRPSAQPIGCGSAVGRREFLERVRHGLEQGLRVRILRIADHLERAALLDDRARR